MFKKFFVMAIIIISAASVIILCRMASSEKTPPDKPEKLSDSGFEPYFNIRGWDVEKLSDETVRIPESFSGPYQEYADVLEESGFDIGKYKGEELRRVTFLVKNYGGDTEVLGELLLDGNRLVGSSLMENKPDGFIKPVQ